MQVCRPVPAPPLRRDLQPSGKRTIWMLTRPSAGLTSWPTHGGSVRVTTPVSSAGLTDASLGFLPGSGAREQQLSVVAGLRERGTGNVGPHQRIRAQAGGGAVPQAARACAEGACGVKRETGGPDLLDATAHTPRMLNDQ